MSFKFTYLISVLFAVYRAFQYPVPTIKLPIGGNIWPKPEEAHFSSDVIRLTKATLQFDVGQFSACPSVVQAYQQFIKSIPEEGDSTSEHHKLHFLPNIRIDVIVNEPCQLIPHGDMDEYYHVKVEHDHIYIHARQNWGIVHAFSSLKQMLWSADGAVTVESGGSVALLNISEIQDRPRLSFRGVLLDTSRHYLPIATIQRQLDIMQLNKLNVFHWHIVDDPSFPYVSKVLPKLSNPYGPKYVYTIDQIDELIKYAANRGIRVIPEFDTPGHTKSWRNVDPGFASDCENGEYNPYTPPVDPTKPKNYEIIKTLFAELRDVFKDEYLHLGGDEVGFGCWKKMPSITAFMKEHNFTSYNQVESYYIKKVVQIATVERFKSIVWEEVFFNDPDLDHDSLVHIWTGKWEETARQVNNRGYRYILSSPWYLNYIGYGEDWKKYYTVKMPDHNNFAGAELCMWGEFVDEINLEPRLWPRASAVAEKMWSRAGVTRKVTEVTRARLDAFRCFLVHEGFHAEPLFPGFC